MRPLITTIKEKIMLKKILIAVFAASVLSSVASFIIKKVSES